MKISFLIAAHNEESIIREPLKNLESLPCDDYEVLLGLDGCSDNTENIVKEFVERKPNIFKYFNLNERRGKPAVINKIIDHATGDIIIIHDADWVFKATKEQMQDLKVWFKDKKVGGLTESEALELSPKLQTTKSIGFHTVAHTSQLWIDYMIKTQSKNGFVTDMKFPFLVNILRKELYKKNETLGDDFERTYDILEKGYKIRVIPKHHIKMEPVYDKISLKDLFKLKIRTARAREQVVEKHTRTATLTNFYIPLQIYFLQKWPFLKDWRAQIGLPLWLAMIYLSIIMNKVTKKKSTTEAWKLRAQRQQS